jgi:uncharacterized membrane protein YdfJ with MMPL/SSD domain
VIGRALSTITDACVSRRGKFVTLAVWLLIAAISSPLASRLPGLYDQSLTSQLPANASSQQALRFARSHFPAVPGTTALIVLSDPDGLSVGDRQIASRLSEWLGTGDRQEVNRLVSVYTTPQAGGQLISPDGTTMFMVVVLKGTPNDPESGYAVKNIRSQLRSAIAGTPLRAYVTGPAAIAVDAGAVFSSVDLQLLLTTVALVLVLLVLLYRSPLLPLAPLLSVGIVVTTVQGILDLAAARGVFPVGQMPANIATVLLFGAGTDYTLFIISRYREELRIESDRHVAMQKTMRAVGEAIASSASAVLLAMLTLLLAALGLYTSLGWVLATAMVVMLLAGLTLVPALLVILGRVAFWPYVPRAGAGAPSAPSGLWFGVGRLASRWPRALASLGLLALALLALGNWNAPQSFSLLSGFRAPTEAAAGFDVLRNHYPPGTLDPTTVYIQFDRSVYQRLAVIDAAAAAASSLPGVASVRGLTRPTGEQPSVPATQLETYAAQLPAGVLSGQTPAPPGAPTQERLAIGLLAAGKQFISADGSATELTVVFADDPYGVPSINRISTLKATVEESLVASGAKAVVLVGGQTAALADTMTASQRDTTLVVAAVLVVVGVVLGVLLRSVVAPFFLLGVLTLNFLAVLGAAAVISRLLGSDGINYAIPLYTFVFLVSLGADYTIFLMSRVREEVRRLGTEPGVMTAIGRTGGVISSAGLILAGTFAVLAGLPLTVLFQLGACVAAGVLLDTFVVRPFIVPGLVIWLGRWAWWPSVPAEHSLTPAHA